MIKNLKKFLKIRIKKEEINPAQLSNEEKLALIDQLIEVSRKEIQQESFDKVKFDKEMKMYEAYNMITDIIKDISKNHFSYAKADFNKFEELQKRITVFYKKRQEYLDYVNKQKVIVR